MHEKDKKYYVRIDNRERGLEPLINGQGVSATEAIKVWEEARKAGDRRSFVILDEIGNTVAHATL